LSCEKRQKSNEFLNHYRGIFDDNYVCFFGDYDSQQIWKKITQEFRRNLESLKNV